MLYKKLVLCVHVFTQSVITIRTKTKALTMASSSSYGRQFELMMTEISVDLVKGLFKERGIDFEDTDMDYIRNFFNAPTEASSVSVSVSVEKVAPEPEPTKKSKGKATKGKGGKGVRKASPEPVLPESPTGFSEGDEEETIVVEKPSAKGKATKGKGKATAKPKCQATTAKGTPCSKFACAGEPFCSVHLAAATTTSSKKKKSATTEEGETSVKKTTKKAAKVVPKHTHGLTSPVPDSGCDLCETHGAPFEIPEYETDEIEEEKDDPTYVLEEEDFDEIDD